MKTTDFIKENATIVNDAADMQQDHEVQMARSDCYSAARYAIELHKMLKDISEMEGLKGWVSEKITLANDYLRSVHEFMTHEQAHGKEEPQVFTVESAEAKFKKLLGEEYSDPNTSKTHPMDSDQQKMSEVRHGNPAEAAITRRILSQHLDLIEKHGLMPVSQAISDVAGDIDIGPDDEIGTSDVSGWVQQVANQLQGVAEGYRVVPGFDREKYQERPGLEGPFHTKSGKVVYYDKVEGKYYDPDTDMYIDYDDWQAMNEQGVAEGLPGSLSKSDYMPGAVRHDLSNIKSKKTEPYRDPHRPTADIDPDWEKEQKAKRGQKGVAEGITSPEIKQAYDAATKTAPGTPERKRAVAHYQKLRADALAKKKQSGVAESTSSAAIATAPTAGNKKAGTLFGGSYKQKAPAKKESVIKR